jgi:flagellar basal-body rod modification protein FlgD
MSGTVTAAGAAAGATASGIGTPKLSADLGTFLTLLTTQLRNQDPTKPMDTETLTQQLVQFATVEQQLAGNKTLEQLLSLQQAGQLANTAPLIGSRVTVETDALPLQGGSAVVVLPAAGQARSATIQVLDAAGTTIRRDPTAHTRSWSMRGQRMAPPRRSALR